MRRQRDVATKKQEESGAWSKKHEQTRLSLGLDPALRADDRTKDVILLAEQATLARSGHKDIAHLVTDTSQDGSRKPWCVGAVRSITTSSSFYLHGRKRRVCLAELYKLMGFEAPVFSAITPSQGRDLLGEAMAVPVVTMVLASLIVNLPVFR